MDLETVSPAAFAASLRGVGLNLLTRDVRALAAFGEVLGLAVHRLSDDFALLAHAGQFIQLHHDRTYGAHPALALIGEGLRGGAASKSICSGSIRTPPRRGRARPGTR